MSVLCDESCRFTSPRHGPTIIFACKRHDVYHTCDSTCTLRTTRSHGVVCPISGKYWGPEVLNDVFGTSRLDETTAAPEPDSDDEESEKPTRKTLPRVENDERDARTARETLRALLGAAVERSDFTLHLDAYAGELLRLYRYYSAFEKHDLVGYIVGFVYIMRAGLPGVAEADPFLDAVLPNANDLESRCGIARNHVPTGGRVIKEARHKMSAPAVKRARVGERAFVLTSSAAAVDAHPEARVRSHAKVMAAIAAEARVNQSYFV